MASNPMQRKARNSFLLGMLLMLIITGTIIAFLFIQIKNDRDRQKAEVEQQKTIYVLNQDVKSGQIITIDMLEEKQVNSNMIPNNAIGDKDTLKKYSLQDKEGHTIGTTNKNGQSIMYIEIPGESEDGKYKNKRYQLETEQKTGNYFYDENKPMEENGVESSSRSSSQEEKKKYIELNSVPVLAKISMQKNTILTRETITSGNNTTSDDVRKQEYNVIVLPTQIQTGDYIDIRLSMPSGEDYIVISKKEVTIPTVGDEDSSDTLWVNLTETEILELNSAIIDAFKVDGSKLYATTYTEPGIQKAAKPTYVVNGEVLNLINVNENIVKEAVQGLRERYFSNGLNEQRNRINASIQGNIDAADTNVKTKVDASITKTQEERKKYLNGLNSASSSSEN